MIIIACAFLNIPLWQGICAFGDAYMDGSIEFGALVQSPAEINGARMLAFCIACLKALDAHCRPAMRVWNTITNTDR